MMEKHNFKGVFQSGGLYSYGIYSISYENHDTRPSDVAHIHNCCEIYFNIAGDVSFAVENKVYPVESGDIIISMPNEIHYCIYNSNCTHEHYCLWLDCDKNFEYLLSPFIERKKGMGNRIRISDEDKKVLINCFKNIINMQETGECSVNTAITVLNVISILEKSKDNTLSSSKLPELLKKILKYIDKNYMDDCSVNRLCKIFFTSRSTINRLFCENLNTTPTIYIKNRRLAAAKELLNTDASVMAVCEKCGFPDCSHFIELFKKKYGITPLKYKKQNKH